MAERYPGGYITKNPPAPTSTAAPGVWTLEQAMQNVKAGTWPPNGPYFIEEVFSTYLYNGSGTGSQTIVNNINLSGKGGMVWGKVRTNVDSNYIFDTVRGIGNGINSNTTDAQGDPGISAFNNNGFGVDSNLDSTNSARTFVTWTFREQPKFFDIVTYTGNGVDRNISHNLGSAPGCVIIKQTNSAGTWRVWHRSGNQAYNFGINLNSTAAYQDQGTNLWGSSGNANMTSTTFSVGGATGGQGQTDTNSNGNSFVAYLFAHNAGGFGNSGSDNVITCGVVSGDATVDLGYEPQWLLFKASNQVDNWYIIDNMRGFISGTSSNQRALYPNLASAEANLSGVGITSTGFVTSGYTGYDNIYIAIRRGPMKTPTSGTSVYTPVLYTGNDATPRTITGANFPVDAVITSNRDTAGWDHSVADRLRGGGSAAIMRTNSTIAEGTNQWGAVSSFAFMDGVSVVAGSSGDNNVNDSASTYVNYFFRRAPGFFDEVCYTGTGVAHAETHNLGVTPEMMIVKKRSANDQWNVYHTLNGATKYLVLNSTAAVATLNTIWNDTAPTSTTFTVGTNGSVNTNTGTYLAYLFATVSGVSKVGSYTGTGNTLQINCGFTNGSRFVLIKRSDSTGDWYVWDSARGIVAGNDPYLLLNNTDAEVTTTDWVDTYSLGFELSNAVGNNVNINTATYIFLAIA